MSHLRSASLSLLLLCTLANAQTSTPSPAKPTRESVAPREVDPEIQQRRSIALSALQSLAIEARSYRDEPLRARVQARVADALWDQDKDGARSLFRRAWDVAETLETGTAAATASATATQAPVMAAVRVPPSACSTSQSTNSVNPPPSPSSSAKLMQLRRARPTRR